MKSKHFFSLSILLTSSFFSGSAFAGKTLFCQARSYGETRRQTVLNSESDTARGDVHAVIFGSMGADCKDAKGANHYAWMASFGPGLKITNSYFTITCPLVRKSRINKGARFLIARASAAAILGANVGVAINEYMGVCVLAGVEVLGAGASASIGLLEIGAGTLDQSDLGGVF